MQLLRHTWWMVVRQARNLGREPIWIVMMIVQPMLWLLLYGQLFKRVGAQGPATGSYIEFLTPGIVAMNSFFGGMWSGMAMINDLDRHVIDRFLAAPTVRIAIVLSQVVRAGLTAVVQACILLLVGLALGVQRDRLHRDLGRADDTGVALQAPFSGHAGSARKSNRPRGGAVSGLPRR